jgi:hypothetical protein
MINIFKKKLMRNGAYELIGLLTEEIVEMQLAIDKLSLENREMEIRLIKLEEVKNGRKNIRIRD